jgi:hypothetical protein
MTRFFIPKIGRHVTYWAANRKPRPGTITAIPGVGSTTLSVLVNAGATTISTVATASVGQRVTIVDGEKTEQRVVTGVSGAGPFTLTVGALRYDHASGTVVRLESLTVTVRIGHSQTVAGVGWQNSPTDTNVFTPAHHDRGVSRIDREESSSGRPRFRRFELGEGRGRVTV